jgi:hypothetical protein
MNSLKALPVKVLSLLGALLLTPLVVLFGLTVLSFVIGLSLITAVAVVAFGKHAQAAELNNPEPAI